MPNHWCLCLSALAYSHKHPLLKCFGWVWIGKKNLLLKCFRFFFRIIEKKKIRYSIVSSFYPSTYLELSFMGSTFWYTEIPIHKEKKRRSRNTSRSSFLPLDALLCKQPIFKHFVYRVCTFITTLIIHYITVTYATCQLIVHMHCMLFPSIHIMLHDNRTKNKS